MAVLISLIILLSPAGRWPAFVQRPMEYWSSASPPFFVACLQNEHINYKYGIFELFRFYIDESVVYLVGKMIL